MRAEYVKKMQKIMPYIKFQNCILINFVTDTQTHGQAETICSFNFSKVGGINIKIFYVQICIKRQKKINIFFFKFSPGYLLIILY